MSTPPPNSGFGVTAEDVRGYDWQAVVAGVQPRECHAYGEPLAKHAATLKAFGDDKGCQVFRLLAAVASFWPNYDARETPYGPAMIWGGKRSAIPEDLAPADLATLTDLLPEINDPEFRARVGDVLWICPPKNYKAAQVAVDAYIESARILETDDMCPPFAERLQRARQVAAQLGRVKAFHLKAIRAIEEAITRHEANGGGLLCARLMHMLLGDGVGDAARYAQVSETLALKMEAASNWHFAREYWQLCGGWNAKDGKQEQARLAHLKIANTYIRLAEGFTTATQPSFLGASHWMAKAVHSLREAKADAADIEAAHQRLLEFQKRGMGEMQTIQIPHEGSDVQERLEQSAKAAAELVKGQSFEDAILRLAYVADPSRPAELRKQVESNEGGVFTQIFGSSTVRAGGQISDTQPPLASDDPSEREEAVVKEMYSQARTIDWPARVQVLIEPARQQVIAEHAARRVDLLFLVQDNPFVPVGREGLFLRGLHAGLHGDIVLALHLLLPQVENSIREIFAAHGVITSKLESDATQDDRDLGWMLTHPEMAKIFGESMAFDLRGLLVERFGLNLRNDIAHGLLAEPQMFTPGAMYAWWLVLRLCCIPVARAKRTNENT